jgi:hypothetical protein
LRCECPGSTLLRLMYKQQAHIHMAQTKLQRRQTNACMHHAPSR